MRCILTDTLGPRAPAAPRPPQRRGRLLPAPGGPDHPHAHRRRRDPRGARRRTSRALRDHVRSGCRSSRAIARSSPRPPFGLGRQMLDRRSGVQPRLPPAPHRAAGARRRRELPAARRADVLPAPGPHQAAVGAVVRRGARATGAAALITKTHHALVDGISGVDLTTVLFDLDPEPRAAGRARRLAAAAASRRAPSSPRALAARARGDAAAAAPRRAARPRQALGGARGAREGLGEVVWAGSTRRPRPR